MALRIRLQRRGRRKRPFYSIVVAENTAPRDGKFIEKIGTYDPMTDPATVHINMERALYWLNVGAQPTETARNLLSREGVLLMRHLLRGVQKGAFDEAEAHRRFEAWKKEKEAKLQKYLQQKKEQERKKVQELLEIEKKARQKKEEAIKARLQKEVENTESNSAE